MGRGNATLRINAGNPELVDTSVWAQRRHRAVRDWFESALRSRMLAVCDAVMLEILRFALPPAFVSMASDVQSLPQAEMGRREWRRALEVQSLLVRPHRQTHSRVAMADLLIAAAAESHDMTLVHYDAHFDLIVAATRQSARWVAPSGAL